MKRPSPRPNLRRATLIPLHPHEDDHRIRPVEDCERAMVQDPAPNPPRVPRGWVLLVVVLGCLLVWSVSVIVILTWRAT